MPTIYRPDGTPVFVGTKFVQQKLNQGYSTSAPSSSTGTTQTRTSNIGPSGNVSNQTPSSSSSGFSMGNTKPGISDPTVLRQNSTLNTGTISPGVTGMGSSISSPPMLGANQSMGAGTNIPSGGLPKYDPSYDAYKNSDASKVMTYDEYLAGANTGISNQSITNIQPKSPTDYSWITNMVNGELAQQQAAINQELARLKQANELAVNQNNTFLQDQMKRLEDNRIQAGEAIKNFQNRRGGFYSGGVDFQTAKNNESFATAEGNAVKDIGARNADINNRNALLAQQAAENLAQLQQQAPARIQQLIQEQMERDRQAAIQEAGITGLFNGQPTMDAQNQTFNQNLATNQFGLQERAQSLDEVQVMARLTGFLPDGTPTTDFQKQRLEEAWNIIKNIGVVPPELAPIVGVQAGTKTIDAMQVAIQQQNANTSAFNAQTSRQSANTSAGNLALSQAKFKQETEDAQNKSKTDMDAERRGLTEALRTGALTPAQALQNIEEDQRLGFYTQEEANQLKAAVQILTPGLSSTTNPVQLTEEQQQSLPTSAELDKLYYTDPTGAKSGTPIIDWKNWYRNPQGRMAGLDFNTWASLYGPRIQ